jgi:hypothetical protein
MSPGRDAPLVVKVRGVSLALVCGAPCPGESPGKSA